MKRKKYSSGIPSYFDAIQKILEIQRDILTGVLPHSGERGSNDEQRLISFIKQILPQRFGVGTGFIVNSTSKGLTSKQNDIIIADEYFNSPLHRELSAQVYPIETVYATIEVKGTISKYKKPNKKTDLDQLLENISIIRKLSEVKKYIEYQPKPKDKEHSNQVVTKKREFPNNLPPRSYLFAYNSDDWKSIDDFIASLQAAIINHKNTHIHGAIVLNRNWFIKQKPYDDSVELFGYKDNSLLRFTVNLLHGIQSMPMSMVNLDNYYTLLDKMPLIDTEDSGFIGNID
ncbi:MAG: hypothetical protein Q8N05_17900 [Bacteroidota bacterium]|nr:hypothetical protein [Bacteroidota bacterium]